MVIGIGTAQKNIAAFALEDLVLLHIEEDVEIAGRCAAHAGFAFVRQANPGAVIDPGRNIYRQSFLPANPACAAAGTAGIVDHLAMPTTGRAGPFDGEEPLLTAYLADAAAGSAGGRLGATLGAGAGAIVATHRRGNADVDLAAVEGVLKRDIQIVPQVGPTPGAAAGTAPTAHEVTEDFVEDVGKSARKIETLRAPAGPAAILEGGMTVPVVGGPLLIVFENFVGLGRFLEPGFRIGIPRIPIRMELHRELPVGGLNRIRLGVAAHSQDFVIILLIHRPPLMVKRAFGGNSYPEGPIDFRLCHA